MVPCPLMHEMSSSLMGTRERLALIFRTIHRRGQIFLAESQLMLRKRNLTLGTIRIRGHHLKVAMVQLKRRTNGVPMNEAATEIGTQVSTTMAVDIRAHGGAPGLNGIRMTGDGKGEMVRAPRSIKIGIITELVHRIPILVHLEHLKMVIWWVLEKISKVKDS